MASIECFDLLDLIRYLNHVDTPFQVNILFRQPKIRQLWTGKTTKMSQKNEN